MSKRRIPLKTKMTSISVKGGPEWGEWVFAFAEHCRMDVSKLIDTLLADAAQTRGFATPPKRTK